MTMRQTLFAVTGAFTLAILATSTAMAQTSNGQHCHKCDYHTAAPSGNPHDLPKIVTVPCAPEQMGDCLKTAN